MKLSGMLLAVSLSFALTGCDKKPEGSTKSKDEPAKEEKDKSKTRASAEQCKAAIKSKMENYLRENPGTTAYEGGVDGETGRSMITNCHEGKQWSVAAVECIVEAKTSDEQLKCLERFPPLRDTGGAPAPKAPGAP